MATLASSQFTEGQVEAARKVNRWTADQDGAAWFEARVHRTHALWCAWRREHKHSKAECRRRAAGVLQGGHLNEPVPDGKPDHRRFYDIRGIGPKRIVERVLGVPADRLDEGAAAECAKVLLAILEDPRLDLHTEESWEHRRALLDTGEWMVAEYAMRVVLPDEPRSPLHAAGESFAALGREDQVAIAATLLLGLHDNVFPHLSRLPDTGDEIFDLCADVGGEQEQGLRLESLVNLVEAAIPARNSGGGSAASRGHDQVACILRAFAEAGGNQSAAARALCRRFGGKESTWRGRVQRAVEAAGGSGAVLRAAGIIGSPQGVDEL